MNIDWNGQDDQQVSAEDRERENLMLLERRLALREQLQVLRERAARGRLSEAEADDLCRSERELEAIVLDLFSLNMGLVRSYAAQFTAKSSSLSEDLESAGRVGLMQAIETFRPGRGKFGSWAYTPVKREILLAVRLADHQHLNASDFDRRPAVLKVAEAWAASHSADAAQDIAAIAKAANTTVAQTRRILHSVRLESLNAPSSGLESGTLAERLGNQGPTVEEQALLALDVHSLWQGIDLLEAREIYVLTRRFGLDGEAEKTLEAIGRTLGLSREAVRQIQVKALAKLSHDVFLPRDAVPADPSSEITDGAESSSQAQGPDAGTASAQNTGSDERSASRQRPEQQATSAPGPDTPGCEDQQNERSCDDGSSAPAQRPDEPPGDAGRALATGATDAPQACPNAPEPTGPGAGGPLHSSPRSWAVDAPPRVRAPKHHYPSGPIDMQWTAGPSPPPAAADGSAPDPATGRADGD